MSSTPTPDPSENAGPTLLTIAIVMIVLCLVTTTLRLIVRFARRALGGDDYTIASATLLALGRVIIQIISVPHGNGQHRLYITTSNYQYVNFLTWLTQLFLFPVLCLLKVSVCLLVLRIKSTKTLRWGLWGLIGLLVATTLLPEVVLLAECSPVSAYWTSQAEKCWTPDVRIYSIYLQTAVSVLADVICTLLPIAVVWNLTLSLRDKVAVCALMSLGVVSTSFACVRASSLGLEVTDLSWTYCWAAIWGDIELGFGILGANLALSRTYYDYFRKGLSHINSYTRSRSHPSHVSASRTSRFSRRPNTLTHPYASKKSKNSKGSSTSRSGHVDGGSYPMSPMSPPVYPQNSDGGVYGGGYGGVYDGMGKGRVEVGRKSWGSEGSDEVPLDPGSGGVVEIGGGSLGEGSMGEGGREGGDLGGIRREVEFRVWDEESGNGSGRGVPRAM